ncbi:hypothetical protein Mp_8g15730 [Marchantia polymorpha subsp. ruderalis]|uniref:protein-tyrosine-phosphatase n=1 Tax=Marchantia polymorpha TaxID=3197 RepID=A0A2R6WL38_MARPO|nr:hypothetical protein MARPO_0079s0039 [Marchantia polymorpha]BBN20019.1 hypothetical protein Mp_8g15730 [Marchantia polymorpha subsp. ruderalis]|eukprot:PTQ34533.1 hypothetical protein MARPO_0079s0039 [Marchantia polymorpha]
MGIGEKGRVDLSEVIRNRLYFAPLHWTEDSVVLSALPRAGTAFCIDNELVYEPFFADFGPLNISCTYRFCWKLHSLLKDAEELGRCVLFYCGADPKKKANAAVLLGTYLVLFAGVEPEVAYGPLSMFEPYVHFRDPTCGVSTYHLTVLDCIRAVAKAAKVGWIDFNNFNLDEYEYFEQVENGDLNWIVPNKLLAFSGPSARRLEIYGYRTLIPEDYIEYFHRVGVTAVIRLNKRTYDRRRFADQGIAHYDLYFPDGSCPTDRILKRFLEIVEETPGALAVHCKAGLGRTGVLIGCYIMKHYRFTCTEVLGYLRMVRPGSVIGPQQHYLRDMQKRLWRAGDIMRQQQAQANANSREFLPSSTHDGAPPPSLLTDQPAKSSSLGPLSHSSTAGAQSWTSSKNRFSNSRTYSTNPVVKRDTTRDLDDGHKGPKTRVPTPARPSSLLKSAQNGFFKGGCLEGTMRSLSLNSDKEPSCSTQSSKSTRGYPYNTRSLSTPKQHHASSATVGTGSDGLGILRNVGGVAPSNQASGSVFVQRIVNSAGQPRKVVLPVVEEIPGSGTGQQERKKRESSPSRRFSSPGRVSVSQGSQGN